LRSRTLKRNNDRRIAPIRRTPSQSNAVRVVLAKGVDGRAALDGVVKVAVIELDGAPLRLSQRVRPDCPVAAVPKHARWFDPKRPPAEGGIDHFAADRRRI
jgi:hypothetical protein